MNKPMSPLFPAVLCGVLLLACSEPKPDLPRLEFPDSMPEELTIGDTTEPLVMIRYFADIQGREDQVSSYQGFVFTSSDPTVVKVVDDRRLLGLKEGTSDITASDSNGSDTKSPARVTVKP